MKIEIEIDDNELKKAITDKLANSLVAERYTNDGNFYKRTIQEVVREIIYKDKENLSNRVVSQASREVKNKALKKIIESIGSDDND